MTVQPLLCIERRAGSIPAPGTSWWNLAWLKPAWLIATAGFLLSHAASLGNQRFESRQTMGKVSLRGKPGEGFH